MTKPESLQRKIEAMTQEALRNDGPFLERPTPSDWSFNTFLGEQLDMAHISFATSKGDTCPMACLTANGTQHYFKGKNEESLAEFIVRITDFASTHRATRMFIHTRIEVVQECMDFAVLLWVAGRRTSKGATYRQGAFLCLGEVLGDAVDLDDASLEAFQMVLG